MSNYKQQRVSLLLVKTKLKSHICNRFYGIPRFEQLSGNFFKFFSRYREILPNFIYMPKFRSIGPFKRKLQKEGAESTALPPPQPYQSAKSPACLGLIMLRWKEYSSEIKIKYLKNISILSLYA